MDRLNIKCQIAGRETELQLVKKAMPGETGPCFMVTASGSFKGYISRQKNGCYKPLGSNYFNEEDLEMISLQITDIR